MLARYGITPPAAPGSSCNLVRLSTLDSGDLEDPMADRDRDSPQSAGIGGLLALAAGAAMVAALLIFSRGDRVDTTNQRFEPPPTVTDEARGSR